MKKHIDAAVYFLGRPGRMVGASKSIYSYDNPKNLVVFNANVIVGKHKVWYGDLDLTLDIQKLVNLQFDIGKPIHVLYESDARFENELDPQIENAVLTITKDGELQLSERDHHYAANNTVWRLTDDEYAAKHPIEARSITAYDQKEFLAYKLPDLKAFKPTKKAGSPLDQFEEYMVKEHGREQAIELYKNMWLTEESDEILRKGMAAYCKKLYPGLHPVKVEQSVAMAMLNAPMTFHGTPSWARSGLAYIRKSSKKSKK